MEKSALIFIGILLFSTCRPILARSGYQLCKEDSDCAVFKCTPRCVKGGCECPRERILKDQLDCDLDACIAKCKAKGQIVDACFSYACFCQNPPM
ncbi:hypothetical protein AALP_AA5G135700 [Arabis alpina]|uniref:Defensin-like protein n=1 Tax=Arabis alpina TaxID=50452 RepID=A0A087GWW1_ARAAL|nr:hypothetical protein AALP_AA5G135700 [Arabis alpina]